MQMNVLLLSEGNVHEEFNNTNKSKCCITHFLFIDLILAQSSLRLVLFL